MSTLYLIMSYQEKVVLIITLNTVIKETKTVKGFSYWQQLFIEDITNLSNTIKMSCNIFNNINHLKLLILNIKVLRGHLQTIPLSVNLTSNDMTKIAHVWNRSLDLPPLCFRLILARFRSKILKLSYLHIAFFVHFLKSSYILWIFVPFFREYSASMVYHLNIISYSRYSVRSLK